PRTAAFRKAKPADRIKNAGMASTITAARNALDGDKDFSNGAYFWDGADIKTNWQIKDKDGKTVDGKVRGHYTHVYESTAAYGGTIFWKYNADFLKATGTKEYN